MIAFTFDAAARLGDVAGIYGGLQQPSVSIPSDITRLTGITDEMVAGQSIDMAALQAPIDPADLLIAHNAGFDRPFCETFSPPFSGKAWACSNAEVDWSSRGYEGTKLGYLIGQAGHFHEGHRAAMIVSRSWRSPRRTRMDRRPPLLQNALKQARGRVFGSLRRTARSTRRTT